MHEMGIMDRILADATATGATHITRLHLRIGPLSGVEPDSLRFAFSALSPGTPAENATLHIIPAPITMTCPHCHANYKATLTHYRCPTCGSTAGTIIGGTEVELLSIEVPQHV